MKNGNIFQGGFGAIRYPPPAPGYVPQMVGFLKMAFHVILWYSGRFYASPTGCFKNVTFSMFLSKIWPWK